MHAVIACLLFLVALHNAGQGPIIPRPKAPPVIPTLGGETEFAVTVEGCIRRNLLKINRDPLNAPPETKLAQGLLNASEFVLEGPKELLSQLKRDHDGHQDEIIGTAVIPAAQKKDGEIKSKELGKRTRITATAGSSSNNEEPPRPVRLKVLSLRHIAEKCSIAGV